MQTLYYSFVILLLIASVLPFLKSKYWMVRICDFMKVHLLFGLLALLLVGSLTISPKDTTYWILTVLMTVFVVFHSIQLIYYTPIFRFLRKDSREVPKNLEALKLLAINVYQDNTKYEQLLDLITEIRPDILLTIETNAAWQAALSPLEEQYPSVIKVPLENTYGMHLYTKLPVDNYKVHYHVSDDLPSIEAQMQSPEGNPFTFYGVHPPPPSPTEEATSKERDGELMAIAKSLKDRTHESFFIAGDFNNVAWARSSRLFRKATGLLDPREGRGLIASFHAKYRLLRVPIDLLFHSDTIFIKTLKRLRKIGSDHFPIYCVFYVSPARANNDQYTLTNGEKKEMQEAIEEGKKEEGNR